jgi:hypothetical protein
VLSWRRLGRLVAANQALAAVLGLLFAWAVTPAVRVWSDDPVDLPTRLATVLGSDRAAGAVASAAGVVIGLVCGGLWLATGRRRPQARALLVLSTAILGLSVAGLVVPSVIDALTVQFRASGRFAWPVLYGVATLGLAGLDAGLRDQGRTWRPWLATAAVTTAAVTVVGLQLLDTSTFRHRSRQQLLPGGEERQAHLALLAELAAAHDQVRLDPDFRCVYFPQGVIDFVDITHAASVARTPIDRIYSARQEEPGQCVIPQQPDLSDPATVWFGVEPVSLLDDPTTRAEVGSLCRRRELINVCTHRWDSLSPEIAAYFGPLDD